MTKNLAEVMNDAEGASKEAINRAEATRREFAEISLYKRAGEQEFGVTDELYEISEATNSDGSVDVEVFDFEKSEDGESVEVWFHTPTMEKQSETMDWPRKDSSKYKFVRLCRKTVGGLNGAEWLKQDGATIRADPDEWEIQADLTRRARVKQNILNVTIGKIVKGFIALVLLSWVASLIVMVVGVPIVWLAALLGITTFFAGAGDLWALALVLLFGSVMLLGLLGARL